MSLIYSTLLVAVFIAVVLIVRAKAARAARLRERQLWAGIARDIAHQIGTPLSALMGWTDILPTAKSVETILPEMQRDLERLRVILNRLSQVSAPTRYAPILVRQLTTELRAYFQKRMPTGERGVVIDEEITGEPVVNGQADLLQWALEHLVKNAADALEGQGGRIVLRAREDREGIEIQVEDSRRGISRMARRRAFDPGFSTKPGGRGLGLALARLIFEEHHGGAISIGKSTAGKGTTVTLRLPKAQPGIS